MSNKLTIKQQKFADEYIVLGNITQAALNAGYSKRTAYAIGTENLKKPRIKAYIDDRMTQLQTEKIADQTEVMEYLSSVMRGNETESVTTAKGVYDKVPVSAKDRIKAAELIGKRHVMWTEKVDLTTNDINIQIGSDKDG